MKKKCAFGHRYLLAYFLQEIRGEKAQEMEIHLRTCPVCQQELAILQAIRTTGEEMKKEIEMEMKKVDWDELSRAIDRKIQEKASEPASSGWQWTLLLRWPVAAGLVTGIILGLMTYHFLSGPKGERLQASRRYQIPEAFLDRFDEELARREVLDYLEKSRLVLLSMKQAAEGASPEAISLPRERIRDLLLRQKYFSGQLDSFRLAKARQILAEIDSLLLELALIEEESTPEEATKLARLIDERRLLLKIQLLQHELEESEETT